MSTFIATDKPEPNAESINNLVVWLPKISIADFRKITRLDHTADDDAVLHQLNLALAHINRQLTDWVDLKTTNNDKSLSQEQKLYYKGAVYHHARVRLLEEYRDFDSTNEGFSHADDLEPRIHDEWREVRINLRALTGKARCQVELV